MDSKKIKPLPGYVLVSPIEDNEKSAGGLYVPESAKDKPCKGKVVMVGHPSKEIMKMLRDKARQKYVEDLLPIVPLPGDMVVYKKWTNQEINHEGKEYLLVAFNELLAIIE